MSASLVYPGPTAVPLSLGGVVVGLYGGAGNATLVAGAVDGGVATFSGVPPGPVLVRLGTRYFATTLDTLDLRARAMGRANATVSDGGTQLSLSVTDLSPWTVDEDNLLLFSDGVGLVTFDSNSLVVAQPNPGSTSHTFEFDYLASFTQIQGGDTAPLLSAASGDTLYLLQRVSRSDGGIDTETSVARAGTAAITMTDKTVNSANTPLVVATTGSYTFDWRRSLASAPGQVNPAAIRSTDAITVSAMPEAHEGTLGFVPTLATLIPGDLLDRTGALHWVDPFPSGWRRVVTATTGFRVRYDLPDGGGGANANLAAGLFAFVDAGVLVPSLSPPRDLRVNGVPAFANMLIAPTPPVLSWQAPSTGTANQYIVALRALTRIGTSVRTQLVATFFTTGTSVAVPPGLVQPGGHYFFSVSARSLSGNFELQPITDGVPQATSVAASGLLSP